MEEKEYGEVSLSIPAVWSFEGISKVNWFCTKVFSKKWFGAIILKWFLWKLFRILRNTNEDYKESPRGSESKNNQLWTIYWKKIILIGAGFGATIPVRRIPMSSENAWRKEQKEMDYRRKEEEWERLGEALKDNLSEDVVL